MGVLVYFFDKLEISNKEAWNIVKKIHTEKSDFIYGDLKERIFSFSSYILVKMLMNKLNLSEFYVENYKVFECLDMIKEKQSYPPPIYDYENNIVIDGMHRLTALYLLDIEYVKIYIPMESLY